MSRWILALVATLLLVCMNLQGAAACELQNEATTSSFSTLPDDDGAGPAVPDLAIEMPELFTGRAPWAIALDTALLPLGDLARLAPAPYLGPLLRPPRQFR